jgi:hypothetical protein
MLLSRMFNMPLATLLILQLFALVHCLSVTPARLIPRQTSDLLGIRLKPCAEQILLIMEMAGAVKIEKYALLQTSAPQPAEITT